MLYSSSVCHGDEAVASGEVLVTPRADVAFTLSGPLNARLAITPPCSTRIVYTPPRSARSAYTPPCSPRSPRKPSLRSITPRDRLCRVSPRISKSFEIVVLPKSCSEDDIDMDERTFGEPAELYRQGSKGLLKATSREWDRSRSAFDPRLKPMNSRELTRSGSKGSRELAVGVPKELKRSSSGSSASLHPPLKPGPLVRVLQHSPSHHSLGNISITSSRSSPNSNSPIVFPKLHRAGTRLDQWWGFVPDNTSASKLFSDDDTMPITWLQILILLALVLLVQVPILMLFSQIGCDSSECFRGLQVHYWLLKLGWFRLPLACVLLLAVFLLHLLDWLDWRNIYTFPIGISLLSGLMLVLVLSIHAYPNAPLAVMNVSVPAALALGRSRLVKCRTLDFYKAVSATCTFAALGILALWIVWVAWPRSFSVDVTENWWDAGTEARLRTSEWVPRIESEYMSPGWGECVEGILSTGEPLQPADVLACRKVKLSIFLVWFSPIIQVVWLFAIAAICLVRSSIEEIPIDTQRFDKMLIGATILASFIFVVLWAWASVAGESLEGSAMVLGSTAAGVLCLCIWLYCSVNIRRAVSLFADKPWCQALRPLLVSDYFTSVLLILLGPLLMVFFGIECLCRWVELFRRIDLNDRSWMFTKRSEKMLALFSGWHWGSICENAIFWCWLFLVINVLAVQMSVVFFAWLNAELVDSGASFSWICVIFYFIGLMMFLIPVIPGIPVYLSAGIILVHVARTEPWLRFEGGIVFAVAECMVLKLHAHIMQQKLFGEFLGHYMWIQWAVGVHKVGIKAIKAILLEPGLKLKKVIILCGGPDWPTSVLTGILHLSTCQMLLGMLPVIVLIIPCVVCGAFFLDSDLSGVTSIAMAIMTVFQGGAMLAALLIVLYDVDHNYDQLLAWNTESEKILAYARKKEVDDEIRTICTEWVNLTVHGKCCLAASCFLTVMASWCSFLLSSRCFEDFDLSDDFYAPLDAGGLDGDAMNLLKPLGGVVLLMTFVGIVLYVMYFRQTSRVIREIQTNSSEMVVCSFHGTFASEARSGDESPASFADESFQGTQHQIPLSGMPMRYFEWLPPGITPTMKGTPPASNKLAFEVPDSSVKFRNASKLPSSRGPDEMLDLAESCCLKRV